MNTTPKSSAAESKELTCTEEATRYKGARYPVQISAHLYFILSGLWLTGRWTLRRLAGMRIPNTSAERAGLQRRFSRYLDLLQRWRVLDIEFDGFEDCDRWHSSVIAPNHPSIIDAVALVSRIRGLDCVMNSRLLHDPVMGGAARLCDYVCNSTPVPMVKVCERRLGEGSNILIFPEATRTIDPPLGPFHHGYALAAVRASAAIRTVFIECDSSYFGRDFSFFRPAKCPMRFHFTTGSVFYPDRGDNPREVSHEVEKYYRDTLESHGGGIRCKK